METHQSLDGIKEADVLIVGRDSTDRNPDSHHLAPKPDESLEMTLKNHIECANSMECSPPEAFHQPFVLLYDVPLQDSLLLDSRPYDVFLTTGDVLDRSRGRRLFLDDGKRRIDFILAWRDEAGNDENGSDKEFTVSNKEVELAEQLRTNRCVFEHKLQEEGLELEYDIQEGREVQYVKIHAPWEVLTRYAEIMKIRMPIREHPEEVQSHSLWQVLKGQLSHLLSPVEIDPEKVPSLPKKLTHVFQRHKEYLFAIPQHRDFFFSNATRSRIVDYILRRTRYDEEHDEDFHFGISNLLGSETYTAAYTLHEGSWKPWTKPSMRRLLYENWSHWKNFYKVQPLSYIKTYLGEEIGWYFAWLGFYTWMLVLPSFVGFVVFIYGIATINQNVIARESCDKMNNFTMCPLCNVRCPYWPYHVVCTDVRASHMFDNGATVFFTCFMSLWGTIYLECWKRKQASLQFEWNLLDYEAEEMPPRPEYLVKLSNSKYHKRHHVSGIDEPYLPFWKKKLPIYVSSIISIIFLCLLAFGLMFGIIAYRVTVRAALYLSENPLLYNNAGLVTSATAACLNLIIIIILNLVYDKAAVTLTNLECRRLQSDYDNALNFKLYLLKFVNYYSSLIYIAFFKGRFTGHPSEYNTLFGVRQEECQGGCLMELCIQLAITFVGKQLIQNNLIEIYLPRLRKWLSTCCKKRDPDEKKKLKPWEKDYLLDMPSHRELYREYLEILIQFGFVTLFVAAFPLAPLLALLNNIIEIRADASKFVTRYRRTVAATAQDIGVWYDIMYGVAQIAIISNAFIITITSSFVKRLVYKVAYSPHHDYHGYVNNSLAYFNVSDFEPGTEYIDEEEMFTHIKHCRYPAYREPFWVENKYKYSRQHWNTVAAQLAFVVIYQNVIMFLSSVVAYVIPDMPQHLQAQHHREKYLVNNIIIERERKIAQGDQVVFGDDKMCRMRLRTRLCDDSADDKAEIRQHSTGSANTDV